MRNVGPSSIARRGFALRAWWPVPAAFAATITAMTIFNSFFDDNAGHAGDHFGSAKALFPMMAVLAVILWAAPRKLPTLDVWALGVILLGSLLVVMAGNLRVVEAIDGENWTDDEAETLGPSRPGFDSGHRLAAIGMYSSVGATVVLAGAMLVRRYIRRSVAAGAILLSVVFPPWVIPGAGIFVVALALCIARARLPTPALT